MVDEQSLVGTVESLDARTLVLRSADTPSESVPLERVLRIESTNRPAGANPGPVGEALFVDGTRVAIADFSSDGTQAMLQGSSLANGDGDAVTAKLDQVRAVRMMALVPNAPTLESEWKDLVAGDAAGDQIVIRKPGASNLNFVEGILGNTRAEAVSFTLDGEAIDVNRNKVFGIIYFRQNARENASPVAVVSGPGLRLPATKLAYADEAIVVDSLALGRVTLPASAIDAIDYSVDRLQYLSDLDPVSEAWTPPPTTAAAKPLLGSVVRDRGFYSPELTLEYPFASLTQDEASSAGLSEAKVFKKGLAIRSRTEVVYRVPPDFKSFRATAGIDPRTQATGRVQLTLVGDGRTLLEQPIRGGDAPVELECNVDGIKQLAIVVDFADAKDWNRGTGDNLHLGGARFIKQ